MGQPIRIAVWRNALGFTQQQIATACEVTVSAVSLWDSGKTNPTQHHLERTVKLFGLTMARYYGPLPRPPARTECGGPLPRPPARTECGVTPRPRTSTRGTSRHRCAMTDEVRRQALIRDFGRRLQLASLDEIRVVDRVLGRLELGRDRYGLLDLAKPRDWRRERFEERLDALVYDVADELATEDRDRAGLREAARTEMAGEVATVTVGALEDLRGPYDELAVARPDLGGEG